MIPSTEEPEPGDENSQPTQCDQVPNQIDPVPAASDQHPNDNDKERHMDCTKFVLKKMVQRKERWFKLEYIPKDHYCKVVFRGTVNATSTMSTKPEHKGNEHQIQEEHNKSVDDSVTDDSNDLWVDIPEDALSPQEKSPETTSRSSSFSSDATTIRNIPETPETSSKESLPRIATPEESSSGRSSREGATDWEDRDGHQRAERS